MSLALAAVELFLLFAPGLIFRRAYLSYPFAKRFAASNATDEVVLAIIPAILLHLGAMSIGRLLFPGVSADFADLGLLLVGTQADAATIEVFSRFGRNLPIIAGYNLSLYAAAAILGLCARRLVLCFNLDRRIPILRFNNDWYYFFTGRQWGYGKKDFDWVWVDALVENEGKGTLYSGILDEFFLARDGGLEMISIKNARRTPYTQDGTQSAPVTVKGAAMILKYEHIRNLNIAFGSAVDPGLLARLEALADNLGQASPSKKE